MRLVNARRTSLRLRPEVQYHPGDDGGSLAVRDVMTPDPITIDPDDPLGKAAQLLSVDGVHHLPIVEDGEIRGLVAQGPILHAIIAALIEADEG